MRLISHWRILLLWPKPIKHYMDQLHLAVFVYSNCILLGVQIARVVRIDTVVTTSQAT
jgi:hypothetical protein